MSAPTLKPPKPRSRLQRLATVERLATAITWVFWITAVYTALRVILALTRGGVNLGLAGEPPAERRAGGLNAAELAICSPLGLKHSEFIRRKRGRADFLSLERADADLRNAEIRSADFRSNQD